VLGGFEGIGRYAIFVQNHRQMKKWIAILLAISLTGCSGKKDRNASDPVTDDPNQALYNQVMDIHDEVMPKMDDIMRLKRELKEKVENSPGLVGEQKKQLEEKIQLLDSAGHAMMSWMSSFKPEDYKGEQLREYLESEMERVKKVKETMLDAIEKASRE
jgi:hypothetical protein